MNLYDLIALYHDDLLKTLLDLSALFDCLLLGLLLLLKFFLLNHLRIKIKAALKGRQGFQYYTVQAEYIKYQINTRPEWMVDPRD